MKVDYEELLGYYKAVRYGRPGDGEYEDAIESIIDAVPDIVKEHAALEAENADLRLKVEELGELCARKTRRLDHQDKVISSQILENAALKRELAGEMEKY